MHYIVFGFSKPIHSSPLSDAIEHIENTNFSHSYVKLWNPIINRWVVFHAQGLKIHGVTWATFQKKNKSIEEYSVPCTQAKWTEILQFCWDSCGIPYGGGQLVGMGWVRLLYNWFHMKIKNPFADGKETQVCSEFSGHVAERLGIKIDETKLEVKGPKWLRNIIKDHVNSLQ